MGVLAATLLRNSHAASTHVIYRQRHDRLATAHGTHQPAASGTGWLNIGDSANLVKIDGKAVPNFYAPGRVHVPAGSHTVALYKTANDATPFRTVAVTVDPSATVKIPWSKASAN